MDKAEGLLVLVADDDSVTRQILTHALHKWGYETVAVDDGAQARELLLGDGPPRLALLDWMMPGYNGTDLCRILRERDDIPFIYKILVTSRDTKSDVVDGLEAGADDYVVKPFSLPEIHSRLEVGARLVRNEDALVLKNNQLRQVAEHLERLADERARQLVHADRMATLGTLAAGIAHEVNNPTSFISGNLQTFERFWMDLADPLARLIDSGASQQEARKLGFIIEEMPRLVEGMRSGVSRIATIVKGLKTYAHRGENEFSDCDVRNCVSMALDLCRNTLKNRVEVEQCLADEPLPVRCCAQQIEQVLVNLLTNAADAVETEGKGTLIVTAARDGKTVRLSVEDNGPGIPDFTTKDPGRGTGLGLSISLSIIENHGGVIRAENRREGGARFVFELPVAEGE